MSATNYAIAYRQYLERRNRSEVEPAEPIPDDYGMSPVRSPDGQRLRENDLAEPLRREVWRDWERDIMQKVRARGAL